LPRGNRLVGIQVPLSWGSGGFLILSARFHPSQIRANAHIGASIIRAME
jgi:hypothetical protein